MPPQRIPIEKRFFKKVKKTDGCWFWTAVKINGYGIIYEGGTSGKQFRAHRVSYEIHKGKIPKGMDVCHTCDVRNCVNPDHLFVGTRSDNMRDCALKGRLKTPTPRLGEDHHGSKLTWDKVKKIRDGCNRKRGMKEFFAKLYNVNRQTIYRIVNHENWIKEPQN